MPYEERIRRAMEEEELAMQRRRERQAARA
jgi:hypothetical protein